MPHEYAVEVACEQMFRRAFGEANSYWYQQLISIATDIEDLANVLRLGVCDPKFPRRWAAVIETKNPRWSWVIADRPEQYSRWLAGVAATGCIPYLPGMTQLLIVDEPDERNLEGALSNRRGSKSIFLLMI